MHDALAVVLQGGAARIGGLVSLVVALAILVVVVAGAWKTFEKAGKPGWAAIISSEAETPPFTAGRKPTRDCAIAGIGRAGFPTDA